MNFGRRTRGPSPALIVAGLLLTAALAFLAFVLLTSTPGGYAYQSSVPTASDSPTPTPTPFFVPTPPPATPEPTQEPQPTATPDATPDSTSAPSPSVPESPDASVEPNAEPTTPADPDGIGAARRAELPECPDRPDCRLLTAEDGDYLNRLATYFSVDLDQLRALNPELTDDRDVHAGDQIRIPDPQEPAT